MTNKISQDLVALVGSRICHDLVSPLGAIANGVELLAMGPSAANPELALISESVDSANARIRFFRMSFGSASGGQTVARSEIAGILEGITKGSRLRIDWSPTEAMPRPEVKLAFLLLQCFESALPWGGRVTMGVAGDRWELQATADRLRIEDALWRHLNGSATKDDLTPSEVQFALAPICARETGRKIEADWTEGRIVVRF